jgi:hypothetical protein
MSLDSAQQQSSEHIKQSNMDPTDRQIKIIKEAIKQIENPEPTPATPPSPTPKTVTGNILNAQFSKQKAQQQPHTITNEARQKEERKKKQSIAVIPPVEPNEQIAAINKEKNEIIKKNLQEIDRKYSALSSSECGIIPSNINALLKYITPAPNTESASISLNDENYQEILKLLRMHTHGLNKACNLDTQQPIDYNHFINLSDQLSFLIEAHKNAKETNNAKEVLSECIEVLKHKIYKDVTVLYKQVESLTQNFKNLNRNEVLQVVEQYFRYGILSGSKNTIIEKVNKTFNERSSLKNKLSSNEPPLPYEWEKINEKFKTPPTQKGNISIPSPEKRYLIEPNPLIEKEKNNFPVIEATSLTKKIPSEEIKSTGIWSFIMKNYNAFKATFFKNR